MRRLQQVNWPTVMSSYKKHMIRIHIYTSTIKKKTKSKLELEQENDSVSATAKSEIPRSNFSFIPKTSRPYVRYFPSSDCWDFLTSTRFFAAINVPIYAKRAKATIRVILILQIPMWFLTDLAFIFIIGSDDNDIRIFKNNYSITVKRLTVVTSLTLGS